MTQRPPDEGGEAARPPRIRPFLGAPRPDVAARPGTGPADDEPAVGGPRPFVITAGRVAGQHDVGLHTQITTRVDDPGAAQGLAREMRAIVALCVEPMSVAEISARLQLHLGVTKILVGDLRAAGYLDVHLQDTSSPYDATTILRVIDGLRALS